MAVQEDGPLARRATRRTFLKYGAASVTSATLAGTALARWPDEGRAAVTFTPNGALELFVNEGYVQMVDDSVMYMRGFGNTKTGRNDAHPSLTIEPIFFRQSGPVPLYDRLFPPGAAAPIDICRVDSDAKELHGRPKAIRRVVGDPDPVHIVRRRYWASYLPRRTIVAEQGAEIRLWLTNTIGGDHRFEIDGVVKSELISDTGTEVVFTAPEPGTYVYHDSVNRPVERVLGLHGVLLVVAPDRDLYWNITPDAAEFERQWIWICHDWDSNWARLAGMGRTIDPKYTPPVPDYFSINDRSGFRSLGVTMDKEINRHAHEETLASGYMRRTDVRNFSKLEDEGILTGQALRLVNTGIASHQLHWHGNHVWTQRRNGRTFSRGRAEVRDGHVELQQWEDVVELEALDRKDAILPMKPPPDALDDVLRHMDEDWHYPMHCHAEMSQTAGGGLYPGGMVADWILSFPLPLPPEVN